MTTDVECRECTAAIDEYPCRNCGCGWDGSPGGGAQTFDAELSAEVATEVMGWETTEYGNYYTGGADPLGKRNIRSKRNFQPASDWSHAGEVLAEIERWEWEHSGGWHKQRNKYYRKIFDGQTVPTLLAEIWSDTPLRAICLAALAAVRALMRDTVAGDSK